MNDKPTLEKKWAHAGLECVVARMPIGHLCGYVRTPDGHPWCGVYGAEHHLSGPKPESRNLYENYQSWSQWWASIERPEDYSDHLNAQIEVHGGVTFTDRLAGLGLEGWWIGFDCAHLGDEERGWSVDNVAKETENLADQIAAKALALLETP